MRLIDADAVLDEICRDQCERKYKDCDYTCSIAAYVANAPTVQPVGISVQLPHVLTQDEMTALGRTGGAVYIEEYPAYRARCCWVLVTPGVEPPEDKPFNYPGGVLFNAVDADGDIWDGDFYGLETPLGWRAWTARPTEEQRKAVKWDSD